MCLTFVARRIHGTNGQLARTVGRMKIGRVPEEQEAHEAYSGEDRKEPEGHLRGRHAPPAITCAHVCLWI